MIGWSRAVDITGWSARRVEDDPRSGYIQYVIIDPEGNMRMYEGGIARYEDEKSIHYSRSKDMEKVKKDMEKDIRRIAKRVGNLTVPLKVGEKVEF